MFGALIRGFLDVFNYPVSGMMAAGALLTAGALLILGAPLIAFIVPAVMFVTVVMFAIACDNCNDQKRKVSGGINRLSQAAKELVELSNVRIEDFSVTVNPSAGLTTLGGTIRAEFTSNQFTGTGSEIRRKLLDELVDGAGLTCNESSISNANGVLRCETGEGVVIKIRGLDDNARYALLPIGFPLDFLKLNYGVLVEDEETGAAHFVHGTARMQYESIELSLWSSDCSDCGSSFDDLLKGINNGVLYAVRLDSGNAIRISFQDAASGFMPTSNTVTVTAAVVNAANAYLAFQCASDSSGCNVSDQNISELVKEIGSGICRAWRGVMQPGVFVNALRERSYADPTIVEFYKFVANSTNVVKTSRTFPVSVTGNLEVHITYKSEDGAYTTYECNTNGDEPGTCAGLTAKPIVARDFAFVKLNWPYSLEAKLKLEASQGSSFSGTVIVDPYGIVPAPHFSSAPKVMSTDTQNRAHYFLLPSVEAYPIYVAVMKDGSAVVYAAGPKGRTIAEDIAAICTNRTAETVPGKVRAICDYLKRSGVKRVTGKQYAYDELFDSEGKLKQGIKELKIF